MGVLVGGESKFGSREDEGIGGDPVDDGICEVACTATFDQSCPQRRNNNDEQQTNNARLSLSKPATLAVRIP
jgi:hypothetical protein